jgi:hypothetical protein
MTNDRKTQTAQSDMNRLDAAMRSMEVHQWQYLVSRITNPTTARIIVDFLDSDPKAKLQHAGIYVRACETVQRSRIRYAKAKKWGGRFARLMSWISKGIGKLRQHHSANVEMSARNTPDQQPLTWPVLNIN